MSFAQAVANVQEQISVSTIVSGFAAVCSLYVLKIVVQTRDAVFGGKENHGTGLMAHLAEIAKRLTDHCTDERQFWDEVKEGRDVIADRAQAAISISEERLREDFQVLNDKVDSIGKDVEVLMERRKHPRTK